MYHSSKLKCKFLGALGQQQIMRFKTVQKKTLNGIMQINSLTEIYRPALLPAEFSRADRRNLAIA
jgi:hypothetical protein